MTESFASPAPDGRRALARTLSALGAVAVGVSLVSRTASVDPVWVTIVGLVGVLAWLVEVVAMPRARAMFWVLVAVRLATGAISGPPSDDIGLVPALAALLIVLGAPRRPLGVSVAAPVGVLVLSSVSALVCPLLGAPVSPGSLIGLGIGLVVTVLGGISRRQFRAGVEQSRELLEERLVVAQERERTAALAERSRIARDVHDVLAHSLGGLVLQLDATEALLEGGRTDEALARVRSSRALAAEGLDEARRAVAVLRDPDAPLDPAVALAELVATHRELGGDIDFTVVGEPGALDPERAAALRGAAREALTNARRHAPGAAVELGLEWGSATVRLRASTPLVPAPRSSVGGGRGLLGVRERLAAVGGTVTAGERAGRFVVEAEVPR